MNIILKRVLVLIPLLLGTPLWSVVEEQRMSNLPKTSVKQRSNKPLNWDAGEFFVVKEGNIERRPYKSKKDKKPVWDALIKMTEYYSGLPRERGTRYYRSNTPRGLRGIKKIPISEQYLFFPENTLQRARSFKLDVNDEHSRIDVQQDLGGYVQVQFQIGVGQSPDHCLASINVKKGYYYAPQHIMMCLLESHATKKPGQSPVTVRSDNPEFCKKKTKAHSDKGQRPKPKV